MMIMHRNLFVVTLVGLLTFLSVTRAQLGRCPDPRDPGCCLQFAESYGPNGAAGNRVPLQFDPETGTCTWPPGTPNAISQYNSINGMSPSYTPGNYAGYNPGVYNPSLAGRPMPPFPTQGNPYGNRYFGDAVSLTRPDGYVFGFVSLLVALFLF